MTGNFNNLYIKSRVCVCPQLWGWLGSNLGWLGSNWGWLGSDLEQFQWWVRFQTKSEILAEIPQAKLSFGEIWKKYPEDQFQISKFEIGPRGIFKIPHEWCKKYPEAQPRGIFDITSGVSRKIARVAIPKDNPKYKYLGNFAQMSHRIAKCRQVYLLLIPRINEQRGK